MELVGLTPLPPLKYYCWCYCDCFLLPDLNVFNVVVENLSCVNAFFEGSRYSILLACYNDYCEFYCYNNSLLINMC